jgi:hypothetical protein
LPQNFGVEERPGATIAGMADDRQAVADLASVVRGIDPTWLSTPELKDARNNLLAELDKLLASRDSMLNLGPVLAALAEYGQKAGVIKDQLVDTRPGATKSPGSGLSPKDAVLLILVALLLMQRGGGAHPTALEEAAESNQLQIVAIVIALAAYLKKKD